jgi:hypothetical protein
LFLTARYVSEYLSVCGPRGKIKAENFAALNTMKKTVIFIVPGPSLEGIHAYLLLLHQVLGQVACYGFTPSF